MSDMKNFYSEVDKVKNSFSAANYLAVFYYFMATILIVRSSILLARSQGHVLAIYVFGIHIHHFVFGFLFFAVILFALANFDLPLGFFELFLGLSLALIFDEFLFWSFGRFDYWSMVNYTAVIGLAALLSGFINRYRSRSWKNLSAGIIFAFALFFIFSFNNPHAAQARNLTREEYKEFANYINTKKHNYIVRYLKNHNKKG
jgi:hypothetical protein